VITLRAAGRVDLQAALSASNPDGDPRFVLLEAGDDVAIDAPMTVLMRVEVDAGGAAAVRQRIRAGQVRLQAQNGVEVMRPIRRIQGSFIGGGGVEVHGGAGPVTIDAPIVASRITADTAAALTVTRALKTSGQIELTSTGGDVVVSAKVTARRGGVGNPSSVHVTGNSVRMEGPTVIAQIGSGSGVDGDQRYSAVAGDLTLLGAFLAPGDGTIEGTASGNLLADGRFRVGPEGCIALSAGGTLDTTGSSFDVPVVADCP
jgi:hypothetical protein